MKGKANKNNSTDSGKTESRSSVKSRVIHSDLKKKRCRETRGLHRKGIHLSKLRGTNWSGEAEKIIRKRRAFLDLPRKKKYTTGLLHPRHSAHISITITVNIYQDCMICQNFLK